MLTRIGHELKHHAPFTLGGTVMGVVILAVLTYARVPQRVSHVLFAVAHPVHVLLSAMVTAGIYRRYGRGRWWATLLIGYVGAVGIGTLSDCVIPFLGEVTLGMKDAHVHAGFIEEWYLVNPLALAGVAIAWYWPKTELPHSGHVLLSTWASLFHMTMHAAGPLEPWKLAVVPVFLFLAVWLPCCTSDIVFPLLFVRKEDRPPCGFCQPNGAEQDPEADGDEGKDHARS